MTGNIDLISSGWDCPSCWTSCNSAMELVRHLTSSHLSNKQPSAPTQTVRDTVQQTQAQPQYICPMPKCIHGKQYQNKFALERHYLTRKQSQRRLHTRLIIILRLSTIKWEGAILSTLSYPKIQSTSTLLTLGSSLQTQAPCRMLHQRDGTGTNGSP